MDTAKELFFAQQTLAALFATTNKLQMQGDKQLQDITLRQMLAIPALVHAPDGKATINHVARHMGTSKQSAKQIVDAMARKRYLAVAPSEQDRRAVNITITPDGEAAFRACSARTDAFMADIFRHFSAEELEAFCALLQKLYRFDGMEQEGLNGHAACDASESQKALRHHQTFAEQRARNAPEELV